MVIPWHSLLFFTNVYVAGTTAEKIIFVGDSAGGNLILSVALQCGHEGVRMPDSILAIYPACVVQPCVSPARLMSVSKAANLRSYAFFVGRIGFK